jgi:2,3-dihydroxyphenylpropionate 1,2-dioxygenase
MAQIVFAAALSHSPLINLPVRKDREPIARFQAALQTVRERLDACRPDVMVVFGPDHFRALFLDLMPSFVVGVDKVEGWGDWDTPQGPFTAKPVLAQHILQTVMQEGFDPAFSHAIKVDHGVTQPLQLLDVQHRPLLPILINCAAPPLPLCSRCYAFGKAVNRAIGSFPEELRVALIASGGLSHDPPYPAAQNAIYGRSNGFAANRAREAALLRHAESLQARINPEWDREILRHFAAGTVQELSHALTADDIYREAGSGGQEIRTWLALAGAAGDLKMNVVCYEPVEALITGMGVITT